ncbi:heterokaryon incompatibility protein-domain-containing protein [Echria macrotheca]|uniref:Heterokaryon incompatibility protein-domain-containing protein n=1 Tax=Echria macrotheca TaxID=438768 RepID=A0AAJ0FAR7_9PEZI|nr:heterokaryon incompatibility protein-domain-containing protein [Echria macrotheca]
MEYLDLAELPALVRDAMVVCRELGERYLWVDRYCIVQDDEADRAAQISAMADIYSAAGLVLVSSGVEGAGMPGISRDRSLPQTSEVIGGTWQVDVQRSHLFDGMKAPWNTRGWTYQEALLNRRKLFFTDSQVYYECGLRITHEENLSYSSFDPAMHDKTKYIGATTSLTYDDLSHGNERFTRGVKGYAREPPWRAYVRHLGRYRWRKLSHLSDLLDAFSGISVALFGKDGVYWGLPLEKIDQGLLWTPATNFLGSRKEFVGDGGSFPSWTWASSPVDVPSFDEVSFSYTLCTWFRPVEVDGEQKLVMISATGDGDPEKHVSSFLGTLGGLKDKWGDHFDLWSGMFETTREHDAPYAAAAARMFDTIPRDSSLRDGMLITRAQVAKLHIEVTAGDSRGIASSHLRYTIRNDQGDDVGRHVYDQNGRLTAALKSKSAFDFIALSVGRGNFYGGPSLQRVDALPEMAVDVDDDGKKTTGPPVNVMIVEREEGCCRRVGLGMVYLRAWMALDAVFETVMLV